MKRLIHWVRRLLRFPNPGELWVVHKDLFGSQFRGRGLYPEIGETMVILEKQDRCVPYSEWEVPGYQVMTCDGNIGWCSEFCIRYTAKLLVHQ